MLDELEPVADEPARPRIPLKLRIAGYFWIWLGVLLVLMHGIKLLIGLALASVGEGKNLTGDICSGVLSTTVGGVFVMVGVQSILGKASGTLGNGIGSIIFGVIPMPALYWGILGIKSGNILPLLVGVLSFLAGLGLMVAGILAILAKDEYRDYRRAVRPAHKRVCTRRVE